MVEMNQIEVWDDSWSKIIDHNLSETPFAKIVFERIKERDYKTLLDVGCGDGKDSIYFAKNGFEVTATDFSKVGISTLSEANEKENLGISVIVKDTRKISFEEKFDVIYANLSLHYFIDKETREIISKLSNMLKEGGVFCIKCKSIEDSQFGQGEVVEENMFLINGKQIHLFSEEYLRDLLKDFDIIHLKSYTEMHVRMSGNNDKSGFIEVIAEKVN
jgi:tellurite methyltransferase